ncbi:sigma-54-dependent transcriptional regulator [Methylocystis bryophila]|uniref:Sigma-54-dependent Fis family transcriptional regulator n=1 Tax=Methylocystis bryophila TaxID=655015 RepID=A0A1W6MQ47_9HYPH|nr:sigma-54 dependent transcriptional regulator [Methylocystis bryophila]ARN79731.1 sigma-54-dependent Fis family transcriptional regulator [Methylocystis bryophila]BDV39605.1 sigma-54-dependent Fis family transcriptional regulator [Methylocystis bryophila]
MANDILIVDDEEDIRELVAGILSDEGHNARTARNADEALGAIATRRPHLVFLDIWLQGSRLDGLQVLEAIQKLHRSLPVVMISGHGNIETAVSAIKMGAYDFIEKPFKADRLVLVAERALEAYKLRREVSALRQRAGTQDRIVGSSMPANQLQAAVARLAPVNSRVLITGSPGVGKELAARVMHSQSSRAEAPFIVINSATMAPESMEVELFGFEGSSPGEFKIGALEEAHGGTLFFDEITDMPKETQAKILRVLVDQNFQRVGGSTRVEVDVRIISSSARDVQLCIEDGLLREDLYHRLAVTMLRVPSLAERREDIGELVEYFVEQTTAASGLQRRTVSDDALAVLQMHDWPGNIRQLRNAVERLMILTAGEAGGEITAEMLPADVGELVPATPAGVRGEKLMSLPLREAREVFEREYLVAQLNRFSGNISRTAEFIGMERSALHRKMKSLEIE